MKQWNHYISFNPYDLNMDIMFDKETSKSFPMSLALISLQKETIVESIRHMMPFSCSST